MDPSFKADLDKYICQCKIRLQKILQGLDWTEDSTIKDYNTNSIASSSKQDLEKSFSKFKATYPDSCVTKNSIVLKTPELQSILKNDELKAPENFQELQCNFSREQKLSIYEHVIKNTEKLESNLFEKEVKGEISLADIFAQKKREEKRKKRRFRKSKPTHIEEVRCLVDLQMQALEQFIDDKSKKQGEFTRQSRCTTRDDQEKKINQREESFFEDCGRKKRHKEKYKDYHKVTSRNKKHDKEPNRHQRSSSNESSITKREHKILEGEKRRRSRSSSKEVLQERKKRRSKSRYKSKERKRRRRSKSPNKNCFREKKHHRSERRSRSHEKEISRDRKKSKKSSYERDGSNKKYSSRSEFVEYSKEKNNDKFCRNKSRSPESNRKKHRA